MNVLSVFVSQSLLSLQNNHSIHFVFIRDESRSHRPKHYPRGWTGSLHKQFKPVNLLANLRAQHSCMQLTACSGWGSAAVGSWQSKPQASLAQRRTVWVRHGDLTPSGIRSLCHGGKEAHLLLSLTHPWILIWAKKYWMEIVFLFPTKSPVEIIFIYSAQPYLHSKWCASVIQ